MNAKAQSQHFHSLPTKLEPYVSPEKAAKFLGIRRDAVIRLARERRLPAHPVCFGKRRQWRFKLSELDKHMQSEHNTARPPARH
jgi:excisionase family DNA binding protein